jgi:hypothetical protein
MIRESTVVKASGHTNVGPRTVVVVAESVAHIEAVAPAGQHSSAKSSIPVLSNATNAKM